MRYVKKLDAIQVSSLASGKVVIEASNPKCSKCELTGTSLYIPVTVSATLLLSLKRSTLPMGLSLPKYFLATDLEITTVFGCCNAVVASPFIRGNVNTL